jgi:hypothetical protein
MPVKTYDPKEVAVTVGPYELSNFADGSFITVERDEDSFSLQVGTDGEGTRSKTNNRSGTITVRLMQSSDSNSILDSYKKLDEFSNSGQFPLFIKDNSGTSFHSAESAWVQKEPSSEYDREALEREWVIRTDNIQSNHGGN